MILRCTQKLLKASGVEPREPEPLPDGLFGDWYAKAVSLPFPGRTVVTFTSATTLLTVIAPGRVLRTTVPVFQRRLQSLLQRLGLPPEWIARQIGALGGVHFAQARDRRVMGCVNHLAYLLQSDSVFLFPAGNVDLDRLELRLAEIPMRQSADLTAAAWCLKRLAREVAV